MGRTVTYAWEYKAYAWTDRLFFEEECDSREIIIRILGGERPKIIPGTPKNYEELMKKCWDPDPTRRPAAEKVFDEILGFLVTYCKR